MRGHPWTVVAVACAVLARTVVGFDRSCDGLVKGHIPSPRNKTWSLVAFVRAQNEEDILPSFIGHYLDEGAERIVILDDRSDIPIKVDDRRVTVLRIEGAVSTTNSTKAALRHITACRNVLIGVLARLRYTWLAFVDADEFVTTRRNPGLTLAQELQTTFSDATTVLAPWYYFCDTRAEQPDLPLVEIVERQSFDDPASYQYGRVHSKSIARLECAHHVGGLVDELIIAKTRNCGSGYRSGLDRSRRHGAHDMNKLYRFNMTEEDASNAYLATYHLRFRCLPDVEKKCDGKSIWMKYNRGSYHACMKKWLRLCVQGYTDKVLSEKTEERLKRHPPFRLVDGVITQKEQVK